MKIYRNTKPLTWIVSFIFFALYFIYFAVFNRYHLAFQEQIQLFRFDWNFFSGFFSKPGGLTIYFGAFFTQFYLYPWVGALIITLTGIGLFVIISYIFRKHGLSGHLWAFIPLMLLIASQSYYSYKLAYTMGLLLTLAYFASYISIANNNFRYTAGIIGFVILYIVAGGYSLLAVILCIIHEMLFRHNARSFAIAGAYLAMAALIPYLAWRYVFYILGSEAWLYPLPFNVEKITLKFSFYVVLAYFPFLMLTIGIGLNISKKTMFSFKWNWRSTVAGVIILLTLTGWIKKYAYETQTELLLGIDNHFQHADWEQVIKLAATYPGTNHIVVYYTNLALYKSGQLADRMFNYNQIGAHGLYLDWKTNNIAPLFGGELYYQMAYINEAYRWAFEALVANGLNPRSLKRLAITSLINADFGVAHKYLDVLNESLFYRKWAKHYLKYIDNETLIQHDAEMAEKRHFLIHSDFWADDKQYGAQLLMLLNNHPDNRMAYEYYMAFLLLGKNIDAFTANLNRLKSLGYTRIPVHFEEALLVYNAMHKKDATPEGFAISEANSQRFKYYLNALAQFKNYPDLAAKELHKEFGDTYWFYLNFYNLTQ